MRATANLSTKLERSLVAYATAAGAAGLGVLAMAQTADAKVVYTDVHLVLSGLYNLDVNNDGQVDFIVTSSGGCDYNGCLSALAVDAEPTGNGLEWSKGFTPARRRGAHIGPSQYFINSGWPEMMQASSDGSGSVRIHGPWANVKHRYLALRFYLDGHAHYGWARFNVSVQGWNITTTLTGYAYETIPDKPIIAGNRGSTTGQGPDAEPVSLGRLALGAVTRKPQQSSRESSY